MTQTTPNTQETNRIAGEIAVLMPLIARKVLFDFFQSVDISQSQLLTVVAVHDMGECRLSDLSQKMGISNPTASGLVDRLVQNGYMKREADPDDRRAVVLSVTDKGTKLTQKLRESTQQKWNNILTEIPQADQRDFIRILKVIKEKVS